MLYTGESISSRTGRIKRRVIDGEPPPTAVNLWITCIIFFGHIGTCTCQSCVQFCELYVYNWGRCFGVITIEFFTSLLNALRHIKRTYRFISCLIRLLQTRLKGRKALFRRALIAFCFSSKSFSAASFFSFSFRTASSFFFRATSASAKAWACAFWALRFRAALLWRFRIRKRFFADFVRGVGVISGTTSGIIGSTFLTWEAF